ncbi:outer membrane protein assembly factor BamB family protein [Pirellulimonas nuda]|uniref:outer membrane protein assembly factor BamB family protein n=1 Tax=Pirellulimonas nuda TaxID=2528009 RepID=UPI001E52C5DD|nr:PQQ-binding-like beta-propeller repeat protein [Pirellulimonas nuda]
MEKQDFLRVFELLDAVLDAEEDAWIDVDPPRSARDLAGGLISDLPPAGKRAYSLHADAKAAREFDAISAGANAAELLRIARRYPHTPTETDIFWLLSQRAWDQGFFESTDLLLRRSGAQGRDFVHGSDRRLQQAVSQTAAGIAATDIGLGTHPAVRWAKDYAERDSGGAWRASARASGSSRVEDGLSKGRIAVSWEAVIASSRSRSGSLGLDRVASDVRTEPIIAKGLVLSRTENNVIATSEQSGRRVWETPSNEPLAGAAQRRHGELLAGLGISSDASRVFVIEPSPLAQQSQLGTDRQHIWGGRRPRAWRPEPNQLSAYDLRDQGKLTWSLTRSGDDGAPKPLSLLGAPLCFDGRLLALIDSEQTVMLIEIDPLTGALLWRQPLIGADRAPIRGSSDVWAGITPVTSDGIVVCPTRGGIVVAFDWVRQTLLWAYRFPVDEDSDSGSSGHDAMWRECQAVIRSDKVLVCSPDSDLLHCVDLQSGEPRWTASCPEARYLSVTREAAIASGYQSLDGFDLATGDRLWTRKLPTGAVLAGRPLETGGQVLLPMTGGKILTIDGADGEIENDSSELVEAPSVLIAHRGDLLAAGRDYLVRYVSGGSGTSGTAVARSPTQRLRDSLAARQAGEYDLALSELRSLVSEDLDRSAARSAYLELLVSLPVHEGLEQDAALLDRLREVRPADAEAAVAAAVVAVRRLDQDRLLKAISDISGEIYSPDRLVLVEGDRFVAIEDAVRGTLGRLNSAVEQPLDVVSRSSARTLAASQRWLEADQARWRLESQPTPDTAAARAVDWSSHQVAAEVQPSRSGLLQTTGRGRDFSGLIRVSLERIGPADPRAPTGFVLASNGSRLMGKNNEGEVLFALDTSEDSEVLLKAAREPMEKPWAWIAGRVLLVASRNDVACYDLLSDGQSRVRLWTASGSLRTAMARRGESDGPPAEWVRSWSGPAEVVLVTRSRAVVSNRGRLYCFDLLSGVLRWESALTDADGLWGSGEHLWVVHSDRTATKLAMVDGAVSGKAVPSRMELVSAAGDRFVGVERVNGTPHLMVCDAADLRVLVDLPIRAESFKVWRGEGRMCGVVAEPGSIHTIDVEKGGVVSEKVFAADLESIGSVRMVGGRLLVFVPGAADVRGGEAVDSLEAGSPFTGRVYSLDPSTGEANWSSPVEVQGLGLLDRQAEDDVLAFGARVTSVDGRRMTRVMLLDAATGVLLYSGELIGSTPLNGYHLRSDRTATPPRFEVELSGETLTLLSLPTPRPPEPPPSVKIASVAGAAEVDIWELGQELKRAFEQAADEVEPQTPAEEK